MKESLEVALVLLAVDELEVKAALVTIVTDEGEFKLNV